jgi:hypothetical protein
MPITVDEYARAVTIWRQFLEFLRVRTCARCGSKNHHPGYIYRILRSGQAKITSEDVETWAHDAEHGFFHGMCTAALLFHRMKEANGQARTRDLETAVVSGILHDFVRVIRPDAEDHAGALFSYFDLLTPDTYTHAEPAEVTDLVWADRMELSRFADWESWVEPSAIGDRGLLPAFMATRECLRRTTMGKGPWARHGLETKRRPRDCVGTSVWPPEHSFMKCKVADETAPAWPIEVQLDPVGRCFDHGGNWHCQRIMGVIQASRLDIIPCLNRDHPASVSVVPIEEWAFMHAPHLAANKYKTLLMDLIARELPVLPYRLVRMWWHTRRKFISMLLTMRANHS